MYCNSCSELAPLGESFNGDFGLGLGQVTCWTTRVSEGRLMGELGTRPDLSGKAEEKEEELNKKREKRGEENRFDGEATIIHCKAGKKKLGDGTPMMQEQKMLMG